MEKTETHPWDPAEHLETAEDRAAYLEAALEDGDPNLIAAALGDIARAKASGCTPPLRTERTGGSDREPPP